MYQELNQRKGKPLGGRSALYIMLQRYHIDSGTQMQVDLTSIMSLKFETDLGIFLDRLDYILLEANTSIPEEFLYAIVEPELRKCRDLAPDFVALDATDDGDPKRTSSALYDMARRCLARKQRMTMRQALTKSDDNKKALVASKAKDGDGGKGKKGRGGNRIPLVPCSLQETANTVTAVFSLTVLRRARPRLQDHHPKPRQHQRPRRRHAGSGSKAEHADLEKLASSNMVMVMVSLRLVPLRRKMEASQRREPAKRSQSQAQRNTKMAAQ
jgi:hypothetical protein